MRGSPLIRLLLTCVLLLALGAGVWGLTRRHSHPVPTAAAQKPDAKAALEITLTASEAWEKCTVQYLDQTLVQGKPGTSSQTQTVELPLANTSDLVIDAS